MWVTRIKGKKGCREKRVTFKKYFNCFNSVLKDLVH